MKEAIRRVAYKVMMYCLKCASAERMHTSPIVSRVRLEIIDPGELFEKEDKVGVG